MPIDKDGALSYITDESIEFRIDFYKENPVRIKPYGGWNQTVVIPEASTKKANGKRFNPLTNEEDLKPENFVYVQDEILLIATALRLEHESSKEPLPKELKDYFDDLEDNEKLRGEILLANFQDYMLKNNGVVPEKIKNSELTFNIDPTATIPGYLIENLIKFQVDKAPKPIIEGYSAERVEIQRPQEQAKPIQQSQQPQEAVEFGNLEKANKDLTAITSRATHFIDQCIKKLSDPPPKVGSLRYQQKTRFEEASRDLKSVNESNNFSLNAPYQEQRNLITKKVQGYTKVLNGLVADEGGLNLPKKITGFLSTIRQQISNWWNGGKVIAKEEFKQEQDKIKQEFDSFLPGFEQRRKEGEQPEQPPPEPEEGRVKPKINKN